jgi:hypothetical protein
VYGVDSLVSCPGMIVIVCRLYAGCCIVQNNRLFAGCPAALFRITGLQNLVESHVGKISRSARRGSMSPLIPHLCGTISLQQKYLSSWQKLYHKLR